MVVVPEIEAITKGLVKPRGFDKHVNTVTLRGKANIAFLPFIAGICFWQFKYCYDWRKEVVERRNVYNARMAKIREEFKGWKANDKVMPKKLLVENETPPFPGAKPIYV